jgi:2'-5' RNA ligase
MTGVRSFIAVDLPDAMRDDIACIQREIAMEGLRFVRPEIVHVTLKFLGDVPQERLGEVAKALQGVRVEPFDARLKGIGAFPGRSIRVVWIGLEGNFAELYQAVERSLGILGFERDDRGFRPHVTIARVSRPGPDISMKLSRKISSMADIDLGGFHVDHFFLKKSTLTRGGPIYEDLAKFPLAALQ